MTSLTELFLGSVSVQVQPLLAARLELDAGVFLVVEPIERATHHRVDCTRRRVTRHELRIAQKLYDVATCSNAVRKPRNRVTNCNTTHCRLFDQHWLVTEGPDDEPTQCEEVDVMRSIFCENGVITWLGDTRLLVVGLFVNTFHWSHHRLEAVHAKREGDVRILVT